MKVCTHKVWNGSKEHNSIDGDTAGWPAKHWWSTWPGTQHHTTLKQRYVLCVQKHSRASALTPFLLWSPRAFPLHVVCKIYHGPLTNEEIGWSTSLHRGGAWVEGWNRNLGNCPYTMDMLVLRVFTQMFHWHANHGSRLSANRLESTKGALTCFT